jgi:hypothetical protein
LRLGKYIVLLSVGSVQNHAPRAIPASALNEDNDDDDDNDYSNSRDDERSGTRYNVCPTSTLFYRMIMLTPLQYSWFHIIFVLGAMYVAMLLTDWYEYPHLFPPPR